MKYQSKGLYIIILFIMVSISGLSTCDGSDNKKIRDLLGLNQKAEIIITDVSYCKEMISDVDLGLEINIGVDQLKDLLLKEAIVISGEEMNYVFNYEYVTIKGYIKNDNSIYGFNYNLAGFGVIFLGNKEFILFGDPSKKISPENW